MTIPDTPETTAARQEVARLRAGQDAAALAEGLEALATVTMEEGDLGSAGSALEEAAGVWAALGEPSREGHCLLLAATTRRLSGDLGAASHDLGRAAAAADLPEAVRRALDVERAEQELAHGRAEAAYGRFGEVLDLIDKGQDPLVYAQLLQRRAAAAVAAGRWRDAAGDLMDAEELFHDQGATDEAEATALGAAAAIANVEPDVGEKVWAAVSGSVPTDGTAAARRGIVGGQVAMLAGDPALALQRFDSARQGALDAADPITYLSAVSEAVRAAEALGDDVTAYTRLATAWVTLGDLIGVEAGRQLVRPLMERLRDSLGPDRFSAARLAHDARAR